MDGTIGSWPCVEYETLSWERDPDMLAGVSKTARRRISSAYKAAVVPKIGNCPLSVEGDLAGRISSLCTDLARFDERQRRCDFDLPALLLRSESAASSHIENLTSSARNIAFATVSAPAPANARLVAANIEAMRRAMSSAAKLDTAEICRINATLMNREGYSSGGELRREQVWIGGYPYSPHGALYVPPAAGRVAECLDDLFAFAGRPDVPPVQKAAIVHAQFESIHPFVDGNGRTGRVLLHKILQNEGLLTASTLPVSAGLLHGVDAYMTAITDYQEGRLDPMLEQIAAALEFAMALGEAVVRKIEELLGGWDDAIRERSTSSIYRLPRLLIAQPVVDSGYVASALDITRRAAKALLDRACAYGILRPCGNKRRGEFYQCDEVLDLLDEMADVTGMRRMLAGHPKAGDR